MKIIDADKLKQDLIDRGFYPAIVKNAIENAPTEDVVPRSEVEKLTIELEAMRGAANSYKMHYDNAKQEAAKGTVEIIQAHLNMLFVALQNEKTDATVEKLIEINSKIAILESIQLALGDVKKKYIGE